MSYGKHTVSNLRLTNCHAKPSVVSQNLGLAALSIGYTIDQVVIPALGIYNNISAVNCSAQYGLLAYSSAGGRIIASNLSASNCTVEAGMVYSGGSGDTDVDNLTVTDCFSTSSAGLSVYAHNVHRMNKNPPEARKKVVTVRNVLSARNSFVGGSAVDAGYRSDVWLATYSAYHGMTLNLRNYMASNPGLTHDVVAYRTSADASVHLSVSGVSTNKALSESVYNVDDLATVEVSNYIQAAT